MSVAKDNKIYINPAQLGGSDAKKITVRWSQSLKDRQEDYYVCQFQNRSNGNANGTIFVQVNKVDELKGRSTGSDEYNVDGAFQYGQKKDGSYRWLVYHNRDNKPYQHRYVENTLTTLGNAATKFLDGLGISQGTAIGDVAKNFIGDYLRNF